MVDKLIHYEDLSPLLAKNSSLTNMSDEDYEQFLEDWTVSAQSAPYVKEVIWETQLESLVEVAET